MGAQRRDGRASSNAINPFYFWVNHLEFGSAVSEMSRSENNDQSHEVMSEYTQPPENSRLDSAHV